MSVVTVCYAACIVVGLVLTVSSLLLLLSGRHMRKISGLQDENRRLREDSRRLSEIKMRLKTERINADTKLIGAKNGEEREILEDRVVFIDKVLGQA